KPDAAVDAWVEEQCAVEVTGGGKDPDGKRARLKEGEERSESVVESECVVLAAAGREEKDGLVGQGIPFDEVEEVLEQTRVGATVDRCCGDEQIGALCGLELIVNCRRDFFSNARMGEAHAQPVDVGAVD